MNPEKRPLPHEPIQEKWVDSILSKWGDDTSRVLDVSRRLYGILDRMIHGRLPIETGPGYELGRPEVGLRIGYGPQHPNKVYSGDTEVRVPVAPGTFLLLCSGVNSISTDNQKVSPWVYLCRTGDEPIILTGKNIVCLSPIPVSGEAWEPKCMVRNAPMKIFAPTPVTSMDVLLSSGYWERSVVVESRLLGHGYTLQPVGTSKRRVVLDPTINIRSVVSPEDGVYTVSAQPVEGPTAVWRGFGSFAVEPNQNSLKSLGTAEHTAKTGGVWFVTNQTDVSISIDNPSTYVFDEILRWNSEVGGYITACPGTSLSKATTESGVLLSGDFNSDGVFVLQASERKYDSLKISYTKTPIVSWLLLTEDKATPIYLVPEQVNSSDISGIVVTYWTHTDPAELAKSLSSEIAKAGLGLSIKVSGNSLNLSGLPVWISPQNTHIGKWDTTPGNNPDTKPSCKILGVSSGGGSVKIHGPCVVVEKSNDDDSLIQLSSIYEQVTSQDNPTYSFWVYSEVDGARTLSLSKEIIDAINAEPSTKTSWRTKRLERTQLTATVERPGGEVVDLTPLTSWSFDAGYSRISISQDLFCIPAIDRGEWTPLSEFGCVTHSFMSKSSLKVDRSGGTCTLSGYDGNILSEMEESEARIPLPSSTSRDPKRYLVSKDGKYAEIKSIDPKKIQVVEDPGFQDGVGYEIVSRHWEHRRYANPFFLDGRNYTSPIDTKIVSSAGPYFYVHQGDPNWGISSAPYDLLPPGLLSLKCSKPDGILPNGKYPDTPEFLLCPASPDVSLFMAYKDQMTKVPDISALRSSEWIAGDTNHLYSSDENGIHILRSPNADATIVDLVSSERRMNSNGKLELRLTVKFRAGGRPSDSKTPRLLVLSSPHGDMIGVYSTVRISDDQYILYCTSASTLRGNIIFPSDIGRKSITGSGTFIHTTGSDDLATVFRADGNPFMSWHRYLVDSRTPFEGVPASVRTPDAYAISILET